MEETYHYVSHLQRLFQSLLILMGSQHKNTQNGYTNVHLTKDPCCRTSIQPGQLFTKLSTKLNSVELNLGRNGFHVHLW